MSDVDAFVIDGVEVRFEPAGDTLRVVVDGVSIGTLELVPGGSGFVARRTAGAALTKPSPWGGQVTARFGTRELGARALLGEMGGNDVGASAT